MKRLLVMGLAALLWALPASALDPDPDNYLTSGIDLTSGASRGGAVNMIAPANVGHYRFVNGDGVHASALFYLTAPHGSACLTQDLLSGSDTASVVDVRRGPTLLASQLYTTLSSSRLCIGLPGAGQEWYFHVKTAPGGAAIADIKVRGGSAAGYWTLNADGTALVLTDTNIDIEVGGGISSAQQTTGGYLKLWEGSAGGSDYLKFIAADAMSLAVDCIYSGTAWTGTNCPFTYHSVVGSFTGTYTDNDQAVTIVSQGGAADPVPVGTCITISAETVVLGCAGTYRFLMDAPPSFNMSVADDCAGIQWYDDTNVQYLNNVAAVWNSTPDALTSNDVQLATSGGTYTLTAGVDTIPATLTPYTAKCGAGTWPAGNAAWFASRSWWMFEKVQ